MLLVLIQLLCSYSLRHPRRSVAISSHQAFYLIRARYRPVLGDDEACDWILRPPRQNMEVSGACSLCQQHCILV